MLFAILKVCAIYTLVMRVSIEALYVKEIGVILLYRFALQFPT